MKQESNAPPEPARGSRRVLSTIATATLLLIGGLIMLTALQRQLIYFPETARESDLLSVAERIGLKDWRDNRGELIGWRTAQAGSMVCTRSSPGFWSASRIASRQ